MDPVTLFAGGAVALVGRKIYDVFEERRVTRRRDHQVLDTLVTELAVLRAAAVSNLRTLNDELDMIERTGGQHWLLTPMTPLSTAPYDLVRSDPPKVLRTGETLSALALAQANAMHNNAVADVRQELQVGLVGRPCREPGEVRPHGDPRAPARDPLRRPGPHGCWAGD